jgi:hypothetical protein
MSRYWKPVVARKHYNGVTIGYIVGWKHRYGGMVRNIRAGLIFKNATLARNFKRRMENSRIDCYVEFEILEDEETIH